MDEELKAQINKNTWEMVIPPEDVNIVGSKWTYCLKKNDKNTIICPKSHLVAQGFTQYKLCKMLLETFYPTAFLIE